MKNNILKTLIIGTVLAAAVLTNGYADSKMYIGTEDSQFIVGVESIAIDVDAAAGLEIRTYFAKKGLVINDVEYGAIPGKTVYTATLAGKTGAGAFARYKHNWVATLDGIALDQIAANSIEIGYGQGDNLLTH